MKLIYFWRYFISDINIYRDCLGYVKSNDNIAQEIQKDLCETMEKLLNDKNIDLS